MPGPLLRATEGDKIRIVLKNELPEPTVVHIHGPMLPNAMDGVPDVTQPVVNPGESFAYEFEAKPSGTFLYHTHHNSVMQKSKGLYGILQIDPKNVLKTYDREYFQVIGELGGFFVINGKAFPSTDPIEAKLGERVRIRLVNLGEMVHPMHSHGFATKIVGTDGHPVPEAAQLTQGHRHDRPRRALRPGVRRRQPGRLGLPLPHPEPRPEQGRRARWDDLGHQSDRVVWAMRFRSLRWLTVAAPLLFLALVDVLRHQVWPELLHPWPGYPGGARRRGGAAWLFSRAVFDRIEQMERQIVGQNSGATGDRRDGPPPGDPASRAPRGRAGVSPSDLTLETVLRQIVDLARDLTGARYGALAVVDEGGQIARFLTAGLTAEERARLGEPPTGRGLLGPIFADHRPIRVDEIARDPRSVGFPPGHPPMRTYLGVPIVLHGRVYGNLYLTDKQGTDGPIPFTEEDESGVTLFAAQAAIAMENARLHGQVQGLAASVERERIARELHDSLAQALGYVRLRAAAARDALARGATASAETALAQIGDVAGDAYAEVREAILGLRSGGSGGERRLADALGEYVERYREQSGVDVAYEVGDGVAEVGLAPAVEVQLVRIVQEALANVRKHARTARALLQAGRRGRRQPARACGRSSRTRGAASI